MVKKGNLNKAPQGCIFKAYRYWCSDLLVEVKFHLVSEHLPDDSDELAGAMPEGVVVSPAFRHLSVIVSLEGGIVLYDIVGCVDECIPEHPGAEFGHPGASGTVITGLVDRRSRPAKASSLVGLEKRCISPISPRIIPPLM